jgi:hypothetical protein
MYTAINLGPDDIPATSLMASVSAYGFASFLVASKGTIKPHQ